MAWAEAGLSGLRAQPAHDMDGAVDPDDQRSATNPVRDD